MGTHLAVSRAQRAAALAHRGCDTHSCLGIHPVCLPIHKAHRHLHHRCMIYQLWSQQSLYAKIIGTIITGALRLSRGNIAAFTAKMARCGWEQRMGSA